MEQKNVKLAWRLSNLCNVGPQRNTLTILTHYNGTKIRAHDSQIVKAKVNLKLSQGGASRGQASGTKPRMSLRPDPPSCMEEESLAIDCDWVYKPEIDTAA